jgi:tetratricopeptide (TPR) repeat protein
MSMRVNTSNPEVLNLMSDAMWALDRYKQSRQLGQLISANDKLEKAIALDPTCMRCLFYGAMVNDLVGKAKDAVDKLELLLKQHPPSPDEVEYNLAVAYYHRYSHQWLQKADLHFSAVLEKTENKALKLLSHAGLAQTHAMWIIQRNPKQPEEVAASQHFARSEEEYNLVMAELNDSDGFDETTHSEIRWTALNARGMSLMYYTDYFESAEAKIKKLEEAREKLFEADRFSPKNWANYCDLGSVHMRLGYRKSEESFFQRALRYLNEVIESLRPEYGFAIYEVGRIHRLCARFDEAIYWFNRALKVDADYRDVADSTVTGERNRAAAEDSSFP